MSYERYKIIVTKDEFFGTWTPEQLSSLDDRLKDYIYNKYFLKCVVFQRDEFKCLNQNCQHPTSPLTIHHIKFQKNGGEDKPKNCVTICKSCHNSFNKGSAGLTFWGMTYKLHCSTEVKWKEVRKQTKLIRKQNQEYHGYKISWDMLCVLMNWLRSQENVTEDYEDD
jgi:hypothetical protein